MTLQTCYEQMGASLDEVLGRLGSEALIKRFIKKFPQDPSFDALKSAIAAGSVEDGFRAAHTMKGVCLNLGLTQLYTLSSDITEKLRAGVFEGCPELFAQLEERYQQAIESISQLDD